MSPITERLFDLLHKRNLTASKVTRELGLSVSSFTDWKKGRGKPSVEALRKLSEYFGVSLNYLITGHEFETAGEGKATCAEGCVSAKVPGQMLILTPEDQELMNKYRELPWQCRMKAMIFVNGMLEASQSRQTTGNADECEVQRPSAYGDGTGGEY